MYLIDTNIIIWVIRGNKTYQDLLQFLKDRAPLSISSITIAEIYKNTFPSELLITEEILKKLVVWDVTSMIAKQSGLYWQQYIKRIKTIHIIDCIIAATAKQYNLTLLTLNTKHFPMTDIKVFDPIKKFAQKLS